MKLFVHLLSSLDVVVDQDVAGGFYATVPALPGCGSQGDTIEETLENLDDAIMAVLEVLREDAPERLQQLCGAMTQRRAVSEDDDWDSTAEIVRLAEEPAAA